MKTISRLPIWTLVVSLMAACTTLATPPVTTESTLIDTLAPIPARISAEFLSGLSPDDVLIQLDYEPGFSRPEVFYPFGRVPPFTLYADGTLIYTHEGATHDDEQVMEVQLTPEEALSLLQQVFELGYQRLESYTDHCQQLNDDTSICVEDASTTILRARFPQDQLQEIKIYAQFANDVDAFDALRGFFQHYSHPAARPYVPQNATLFLRRLEETRGVPVQDWPLDPAFLAPLQEVEQEWAWPLGGEDLARLLEVLMRNIGDAWFVHDGRFYNTFLVPWLPGSDHSQEIKVQFPPVSADTKALPAVQSEFAECPAPEPALEAAAPVAFVSQGQLWLMDGEPEPRRLTPFADVRQVKFSPDGQLLAFVRQPPGKAPELWVVNPNNGRMRTLLGKADLQGDLRILSLSDSNDFVAFTHEIDEHSAELWTARTDGTGAARMVSAEELLGVLPDHQPEPLGVIPSGVAWLPKTHILTYDAFPIYDAIQIYVQTQAWVVDAESGEQALAFPAEEGGAFSFSPDGTSAAVIRPDGLRFMNLEERVPVPAAVDYAAVGFGHQYFFPAPTWEREARSVLLALPQGPFPELQDADVTIWRVPTDGSLATPLGTFSGFAPSFEIAPDGSWVSYWRTIPDSNIRELMLSNPDGSQTVLYETAENLGFLGWSPDSQHFVYWRGDRRQPVLGHICKAPSPLEESGPINSLMWINPTHFLYTTGGTLNDLDLHLGSTNGNHSLLGSLEGEGSYDSVITPSST